MRLYCFRRFLLMPLLLTPWFFPLPLAAQNISDIAGDTVEETEGQGLVIRTKPAGARVFIDGLERGLTPLTLDKFQRGEYHVRLVKEGYRERRFQITISASSRLLVSIELEEATGRVQLRLSRADGSPGPEILPFNPVISADGGISLYPGPEEKPVLKLPVGRRTIRVRAFGWEDAVKAVLVREDWTVTAEFILKPAVYVMGQGSVSRRRFNPANSGSLGRTEFRFEVSAPGRGVLRVKDSEGRPVYTVPLGPFQTWSQSVVWDGRDSSGELLPEGVYQVQIETEALPWDDTPPRSQTIDLETVIDDSADIYPLSLQGLIPGLLFAPVPAALPVGSFQLETGLFFGKTAPGERAFSSLPFDVGIRFSPLTRLELTALMNVLPDFGNAASWALAGSAKWFFFPETACLPVNIAAGLSYAWESESGTAPLGPGAGLGFYIPLSWRPIRPLSVLFSPGMRIPIPGDTVPRLVLSGGLLFRGAWFTSGFSIRPELNFSPVAGRGGDAVQLFMGGELKLYPPPSNLVFSLSGGAWFAGSEAGGFGGVGIGFIY
ncbi:MAG: PEGA domain-containing protein [Treponema sp.]|jgi:hypothetical protein|nr:PEGA domain-containing protein [Treponema sp.]